MASKILPGDLVDLKLHSDYNGDVRCSLDDASMSDIYSMILCGILFFFAYGSSSLGEVSSYAGFVFWTWRMTL